MAEQSIQNYGNFQTTLYREIYKNSWLKKLSSSNSKKRKEKLWVVFCVHDDREAFLETYLDNKIAVLHKPEWFVSLNNIQHVSTTICPHEQDYEFAVTLEADIIRLAAPTWDTMFEWVECLRGKLNDLKILSSKENMYSKLPEPKGIPLLPTRDPTSPLPPPPPVPPELLPGMEPINRADFVTSPNGESFSISIREISQTTSSCDGDYTRSHTGSENDVFNFDALNQVLLATPPLSAPPTVSTTPYEHLFQINQDPGPSSRETESQRFYHNCSTRILQPPPRPYRTLREQQVLQLQNEMKHPTGVKLEVRRRDCINAIALVDAFNSVWISGWKQREHPMLYNVLHIGDQLVNIDGIDINSAFQARKILKSRSSLYVNIIIRRVPHGEVFVIHREAEGQPLGILQDNNTATIKSVEANGLAARHGLTVKAKTCDGASYTNWVLTEINGRPLNLFFKKNQVKDRLNAVGRDISILVQPLDLIKQLKKELKSYRYYKDYIVQ